MEFGHISEILYIRLRWSTTTTKTTAIRCSGSYRSMCIFSQTLVNTDVKGKWTARRDVRVYLIDVEEQMNRPVS